MQAKSKEQRHFQSMFLYLPQELPDILKKMPNHYSDPILLDYRIIIQ